MISLYVQKVVAKIKGSSFISKSFFFINQVLFSDQFCLRSSVLYCEFWSLIFVLSVELQTVI